MGEKPKQMPLVGAYLLLIQDGKLLMGKPKKGPWVGTHWPVAGHTEEGETVIEAIIREAEEEAGITLNPNDLSVKLVMHRPQAPYKGTPTDIIDFFIEAKKYSGTICNNEPEKCTGFDFYDLNHLPKELTPNIKMALECYKRGDIFYAFK